MIQYALQHNHVRASELTDEVLRDVDPTRNRERLKLLEGRPRETSQTIQTGARPFV